MGLTNTHFKFTYDRIQHYANDNYKCLSCEKTYHPKVHSQPYLVQFGAILLGLLIFFLIRFKTSPWVYAIVFIVLPFLLWKYMKRARKEVSQTVDGKKPRYGDIIIECPYCGNNQAIKVGEGTEGVVSR